MLPLFRKMPSVVISWSMSASIQSFRKSGTSELGEKQVSIKGHLAFHLSKESEDAFALRDPWLRLHNDTPIFFSTVGDGNCCCCDGYSMVGVKMCVFNLPHNEAAGDADFLLNTFKRSSIKTESSTCDSTCKIAM